MYRHAATGNTCHAWRVRIPVRRPRRHQVCVPEGVDLAAIAMRVRYVGSAEHKTYPSDAGPPRPRADATKCDPRLHGDFRLLTEWLQKAIGDGRVGAPWEGDFPRYVWVERGGTWYEARLVNRDQGTYKGYAITDRELPEGL